MCSGSAATSRAPARTTQFRVLSGNPGSCPLQSSVCGQAILRTHTDHAHHPHGGHPSHRQVQLPMHVCSSRGPHHAPSPWYSNWLSAEPSTQPHMRRKARSHLAAYLWTMVHQSQRLFGAICGTFTVLPSCWNKWGLQSSSASSSMWATRFTTKPLAKSGR